METLSSNSRIMFYPVKKRSGRRSFSTFCSKNENNDGDIGSKSDSTNLVPIHFPLSSLSKDAAMGLVISAAAGRGWTTDSGMEGPPNPVTSKSEFGIDQVSTLPWSLFTKSPRRRMRVAFTCNVCGQRTTRAINPHAYTDGTVFVQCCGCNVFHKLVDNLNLFHDMKCYVSPNFGCGDSEDGEHFKYLDVVDDDTDFSPF